MCLYSISNIFITLSDSGLRGDARGFLYSNLQVTCSCYYASTVYKNICWLADANWINWSDRWTQPIGRWFGGSFHKLLRICLLLISANYCAIWTQRISWNTSDTVCSDRCLAVSCDQIMSNGAKSSIVVSLRFWLCSGSVLYTSKSIAERNWDPLTRCSYSGLYAFWAFALDIHYDFGKYGTIYSSVNSRWGIIK